MRLNGIEGTAWKLRWLRRRRRAATRVLLQWWRDDEKRDGKVGERGQVHLPFS